MKHYKEFKEVFSETENLPENKEKFLQRAYFFFMAGRRNKEMEIYKKLNQIIESFLM